MAHQLDFGALMLTARQKAIYDTLCAAAESGAPCPTNTDLTEVIKASGDTVRFALDELEKLGMIRRTFGGGRRTVVIAATGKETRTTNRPVPVVARHHGSLLTADEMHQEALAGKWFEDHPRAKPTTNPRFYPARHQAYGHEAMC